MCLSPISSHNILVLKGLVVTSSLIFASCTPMFCRTVFGKHCLTFKCRLSCWVSAPYSGKVSDISEERTTSVFRVTELVQVDAEVL
jgi:hypothetical protein